MFREMLRIRNVELHMESLYHLDEMKTPIHLCIGQEAVAVGVCAALRKDDTIMSNHRGHGHYLAKGGDLRAMIAELYCRETGCSRGRGGSMHLVDISVGHPGSSSIVGGGIPICTGIAIAFQMKKLDRVSAVFFGDGAADEGVLYESLNFAMLKKLPAIYIFENNQWSVCSPVSARHPCENVFHKAPQGKLMTKRIDGNDVAAVYNAAVEAVARARAGQGPSFIECITYRIRGHAGSFSDANLGYRTQDEIDSWEARCPVEKFKKQLLEDKTISGKEIEAMNSGIQKEIEEAFEYAQNSPLPKVEDVGLYLFKE